MREASGPQRKERRALGRDKEWIDLESEVNLEGGRRHPNIQKTSKYISKGLAKSWRHPYRMDKSTRKQILTERTGSVQRPNHSQQTPMPRSPHKYYLLNTILYPFETSVVHMPLDNLSNLNPTDPPLFWIFWLLCGLFPRFNVRF